MFSVYGVCSVWGVFGWGGAVMRLCCVDVRGCYDKESVQGVTGDTRRAGVFAGVLCMGGGSGLCVGVCLVSAVCGRVGRFRSCVRV